MALEVFKSAENITFATSKCVDLTSIPSATRANVEIILEWVYKGDPGGSLDCDDMSVLIEIAELANFLLIEGRAVCIQLAESFLI